MSSEAPKQWIVLRKDLKMRKGKMVAQGGHGVVKIFFDRLEPTDDKYVFTIRMTEPELAWKECKFTKIGLGARSEEELHEVYEKAKAAGLLCVLITDAGLTEFHGALTDTCVVIGPAYPSQVEAITGDLPLL